MRRGTAVLFAGVLALGATGLARPRALAAQATPPGHTELIDRVAAIVGDRVVLLSEIDEMIQRQRAAGLSVPDDSAQYATLRRAALSSLIDEEVLYQAARRDTTIQVADAEVQTQVENAYREARGQYRTERDWRQQLHQTGFETTEEYRRYQSDQVRRQMYIRQYVQKLQQEGKLHASAPSEQDLRQAYANAMRDTTQVQRRPPTVTFRQIVITPQPSAAARALAQEHAESALVQLQHGADFATLARRLSDDQETKEQGGDLGWFRRGTMVREFEDVAFRMRPGVPSPIVRTSFGYHIILVERVQPGEIKARHILFAPAITDSELTAAHQLADSVSEWLRHGANFDSLAAIYSDTSEPRTVGPLDRTRMTPDFQQAFRDVSAGQILAPIALFPDVPARTKYVVPIVTDIQPERQFTFEEVRDYIRSSMQQQRAQAQLVGSLRRSTYLDIKLQ